jgi:tRNA(Ile)-lysidine synthase
MRDQVLRYIRSCGLIKAGNRVLLAVSGGADSVALLRVLLELRDDLGIVLAVAHLNHQLRGESADADEAFVRELAATHGLDFFVERAKVAEHAEAERIGLESAGRKLRYEWLAKIAGEHRFDAVATAHTADDQAETVLMKFLRGAGTRGLAGIYPLLRRGAKQEVRFVRPLLGTTRREIESYLESLEQPWREDETNLDRRFLRNRVRHELLPLLERDYNPNIREVLSETAEINREEELYLEYHAGKMLRDLRAGDNRIRVDGFVSGLEAMERRVLRRLLDGLGIAAEFQHVERLRLCASGELRGTDLLDGWYAQREGEYLVLRRSSEENRGSSYEHILTVPGEVKLVEIGCTLRVVPVPASFADEADPGTLLAADLVGSEVCIRNWRPGDRYHVAYTGKEQKLKTLFLERKIPAAQRPLWPVMLKGTDIVWVRDLPVADAYCWRAGDGDALRVECLPG